MATPIDAVLGGDLVSLQLTVPENTVRSGECDMLTLEAVTHRSASEVLDYVFKRSRFFGYFRETPADRRLDELFVPSDEGNSTLVTVTSGLLPEGADTCRICAGEDYTTIEIHPPGDPQWQYLATIKRRGQRINATIPTGSGLRALSGGSIAVMTGFGFGGDYNFVPCAYAEYAARQHLFFAFRSSDGGAGWVETTTFSEAADVELVDNTGAVVDTLSLPAYSYGRMVTQGNVEHLIRATAPVSAVVRARSGSYDIRIVYPPTTKLICHLRNGRVTALEDNTSIELRTSSGAVLAGTSSPGNAYSMNGNAGYNPDSWAVITGDGPFTASSTADGKGLSSTSGVPFEFLAQMFPITHQTGPSTNPAESGISVASPWEGAWRAYDETGVIVHTGFMSRRGGTTDQTFPAADQWVPGASNYGVDGGWVEMDVPGVLVYNGYPHSHGYTGASSDGSEWNLSGTTPDRLRTIFREIGGETYRLARPGGGVSALWERA